MSPLPPVLQCTSGYTALPSLDLPLMLSLMQLVWSAQWCAQSALAAAWARCWLLFNLQSTRTPHPFLQSCLLPSHETFQTPNDCLQPFPFQRITGARGRDCESVWMNIITRKERKAFSKESVTDASFCSWSYVFFFPSLSVELLKNCTVSVVTAALQFANMLC